MKMLNHESSEWKHITAEGCYTKNSDGSLSEPVGLDLFDDELENQTSIYIRHENGLRWPARTVNMTNDGHWQSVLEAWFNGKRGPINDYRTKYFGVGIPE